MQIQDETIDILNTAPKNWYRALLTAKKMEIKRKESWQQELTPFHEGHELPLHIDWEKTFLIPFSTTRETKLHSFQYRISHRLITCNKYLHKVRLREDSACTSCGSEDTIVHFLIECAPVRLFWTDLDNWCNNHTRISLSHLTVAEKILGLNSEVNQNNMTKLQNWIILTAKYFIHREKLFGQGGLSLIAFLGEARKKLYTERLACQLEGKTGKFKRFKQLYQALGGQIDRE